jgi:hypothetical protein
MLLDVFNDLSVHFAVRIRVKCTSNVFNRSDEKLLFCPLCNKKTQILTPSFHLPLITSNRREILGVEAGSVRSSA